MNKYEGVIIIKPTTNEEEIENIITKVKNIINQNGNLTEVKKEGLKALAYEIKKCNKGYYVIFYFNSDPEIIKELERYFRITEDIIKFITVRLDED